MAKMTIKVKKIEKTNTESIINARFFGTRPGGRVSLEVKLLIGALGALTSYLAPLTAPQRPPKGQKWLKMTIIVKQLKNYNRINN